jgi:hypothetical protein
LKTWLKVGLLEKISRQETRPKGFEKNFEAIEYDLKDLIEKF